MSIQTTARQPIPRSRLDRTEHLGFDRWLVHHELKQKIHVDALTGLYNRRFLDGQLPLMVERAERNQTSLTMIVANIDLFKPVNTKYGFMIGDQWQ